MKVLTLSMKANFYITELKKKISGKRKSITKIISTFNMNKLTQE